MNRYRFVFSVLGTALIFALAVHAQQATSAVSGPVQGVSSGDAAGLPSVEAQLGVLTEKLGLTSDQQQNIKPILKDLHDATEKLAQDQTLSPEDRLAKVRPERRKADTEIRALLSDDQKKKLDQYEQGPHPEMHGNVTGNPSSQQQ